MEEEAWERLGSKEEEEGVFIPPPPNLPVGHGGPRAPGVVRGHLQGDRAPWGPGPRAPRVVRDHLQGDRAPGGPGPRAPGVKGPGTRTIQRHWARGPGT